MSRQSCPLFKQIGIESTTEDNNSTRITKEQEIHNLSKLMDVELTTQDNNSTIITEEEEIRTLSKLMADEWTTEDKNGTRIPKKQETRSSLSQLIGNEFMTGDNTMEIPNSDNHLGHTTIFLFPAIMEIRQQRVKVVAIGPYYHNEKMLVNDDFKWQVVNILIHAFQLDTRKFFRNMVTREKELRGCYEEDSDDPYRMTTKDFLQMVLFDGCFILFALKCFSGKSRLDIIELFVRKLQSELGYSGINNLHKILNGLMSILDEHQESFICDLLQMENQIPLWALQELLHVCPCLGDFVGSSIQDLALSCFRCVRPKAIKEKYESDEDFLHLLDIFHWSRVPKDKYKMDERFKSPTLSNFRTTHVPDHHAGMKFRKSSSSSLDVDIKRLPNAKSYVIKLPTIDIKTYQFLVFESLIMFEARFKQRGYFFTTFVECMASLLESEKDVKLLQKSGIILKCNEVSDDYVIAFFHQLNRCIKPLVPVPQSYDEYMNSVDFVQETAEISEEIEGARCWFRF